MPDNKDAWPLKSAQDVAGALDWIRRRMNGSGLVLVAIGTNSVAYALDAKMPVRDAMELLQAQIDTGAIERGFEGLKLQKVTRGCGPRGDLKQS